MEKIKPRITNWVESEKGKDILTVVIVVLVGLGSFELGRLSKGNAIPGIKIEYPGQDESQAASVILSQNPVSNTKATAGSNSTGKAYFASSKGSKYYTIGCSAGKTLKLENRIYFTTREEAEKAGYELSSSCK